jgi:hypothetical protein
MADRRKKVKQGLQAVLKRTMERDETQEEAPESGAAEVETAGARHPRSYTRLPTQVQEEKRHTSVYLYPSEFEMLDDIVYALRKNHAARVAKTELWRALLHIAGRMVEDPGRVEELIRECVRMSDE